MENGQSGDRIEISSTEYISDKWWEKKEWSMLSDLSRSVKVSEGYEPPVHDFSISNDYGDITDSILNLDEVWLLVAYNEAKTSAAGWEHVLPTAQRLMAEGKKVIALSASQPSDFNKYGVGPELNFAATDETTLKTMVRSNPGWVKLERGKVVKKYHHIDSPN
jgi:hypothetical protein